MLGKSFFLKSIPLLALTVAWVFQPHSVTAQTSVPAKPSVIPQWQSTQEDPATWNREPFKPTGTSPRGHLPSDRSVQSSTSPELALQGIMKSNSHFYAIINGTTVKPGNRIEGWTVTGISRHRVTLRRDKETQIFDIYQGKIDRGTR